MLGLAVGLHHDLELRFLFLHYTLVLVEVTHSLNMIAFTELDIHLLNVSPGRHFDSVGTGHFLVAASLEIEEDLA